MGVGGGVGVRVCERETNLCLGMPGEVEAVGLTGHRQGAGESVMIYHVVAYVVQFCIQTCRGHSRSLVSGRRLV